MKNIKISDAFHAEFKRFAANKEINISTLADEALFFYMKDQSHKFKVGWRSGRAEKEISKPIKNK